MRERIKEKINQIEKYLEKILNIVPETFEEYSENEEKKWSCERGVERIAEALADLGFLILKEREIEEDLDDFIVFDILAKYKVISGELSKKMQELKSMRNIIVHLYGEVNDETVYNSIKNELEKDVNDFLDSIRRKNEI